MASYLLHVVQCGSHSWMLLPTPTRRTNVSTVASAAAFNQVVLVVSMMMLMMTMMTVEAAAVGGSNLAVPAAIVAVVMTTLRSLLHPRRPWLAEAMVAAFDLFQTGGAPTPIQDPSWACIQGHQRKGMFTSGNSVGAFALNHQRKDFSRLHRRRAAKVWWSRDCNAHASWSLGTPE